MAVSAKLGELFVQFVAQTRGFDGPLNKSRGVLGSFGKTIGSTIGMLRGWTGAIAGAAGVGTLAASTEDLKSLKLQADLLGISTETLGEYRYAAQQVSIDNRQLVQSMSQLGEKIADLRTGAGESVELFRMLGVEAKEFDGLRVDQSFELVGKALSKLGKLEQLKVGSNLLEDEGIALLNFFPILQQAKQEFRALGGAISRDHINDVSALDNEYRKLMASLGVLAKQITVGIAPELKGLLSFIQTLTTGIVGIRSLIGSKSETDFTRPGGVASALNFATTGSATGVAPEKLMRGALTESIIRENQKRLGVYDGGPQDMAAISAREQEIMQQQTEYLQRIAKNTEAPQRTAGF